MNIRDFQLERYFDKHEFTAKYLLSSSDCDGFDMNYVLDIATQEEHKMWSSLKLGYTESMGHPKLREAILQYYNFDDINNAIVASPGELNFITMNVLLNPSDHVVSVSPAYQSLHEIVRTLGCELSLWQPEEDTWKFDVSKLETLIKDNTKLIVINFPHNPTGAYLTPEEQQQIVDIARKNDIYIFSDEMYFKLVSEHAKPLPPICDIYEKGISLWGTSKTFGLAGLRTGWLVTHSKDLLKKIGAFKDYLSICNSAPAEVLTTIALNHIKDFLNPNLEKIKRNVEFFKTFVSKHDIFSCFTPPIAATTAFVKLNIGGSSLDFSTKLVEKTGIMTVPAEMFDYEGKYIRIGFGRKNLPEIFEILNNYILKLTQT